MANLNNLFNSEESLSFTITILMTTKYIVLNKGGNLSQDVINNVLGSKFSDFWRDFFLALIYSILSGTLTSGFMLKGGIYFMTLFLCICNLFIDHFIGTQAYHYYSCKKGSDKLLTGEWDSSINFMCALKFKHIEKESQLKPFEKLSEKEQHLLELGFASFWLKMMFRRNICVLPVVCIVKRYSLIPGSRSIP